MANIGKYQARKHSIPNQGNDGANHAALRDIPLDDTRSQTARRTLIIASDEAFQAAMDRAIEVGLESASTQVSTAPCTKNPILVLIYE
jgi:hypothetical protein